MAEYISREAALLSLTPIVKRASERNRNIYSAVKQCVEAINWCPVADVVERKHGKWVGYPECLKYTNAYSDDHIVCSACEECFSILDNDCERFNFCPKCGADMREEQT